MRNKQMSNLIKDGKYYNIFKATLICQIIDGREGISRYYKSQTGVYYRTRIGWYKINPTRDDEKIEVEVEFNQMRTIIEACQRKAPYFGNSNVFELPEEFTKITEV